MDWCVKTCGLFQSNSLPIDRYPVIGVSLTVGRQAVKFPSEQETHTRTFTLDCPWSSMRDKTHIHTPPTYTLSGGVSRLWETLSDKGPRVHLSHIWLDVGVGSDKIWLESYASVIIISVESKKDFTQHRLKQKTCNNEVEKWITLLCQSKKSIFICLLSGV